MKIFKSKHKLKEEISNIKNISFVPTMGGLHKGHISLIKKSQNYKGKTLVSIFVNPKQFNEKKDFINYPRNLKKDLKILKHLKVDLIYLPSFKDVFSFQVKNKIFLDKFSKKLCGRSRKDHFKGVLNIVNRFLELIKPKYIFLGIKDFQQSYLISKHILKRKINTKVINCNTIREKNGVACSTRNNNLNKNQFKIASNVIKYLKNKKRLIKKEFFNSKSITIKKDLINLGVTKIDYIEFYNSKTLRQPKSKREKFKIFIAFYLNKTRLIDNI
ncbi:pantoate--beta-alanine ligase [Pelagibacterales bacterium SAG-MED29]|nr:pantoate--beta-alanine ligase [Pelagibacterales bacterium SAG-MED29]